MGIFLAIVAAVVVVIIIAVKKHQKHKEEQRQMMIKWQEQSKKEEREKMATNFMNYDFVRKFAHDVAEGFKKDILSCSRDADCTEVVTTYFFNVFSDSLQNFEDEMVYFRNYGLRTLNSDEQHILEEAIEDRMLQEVRSAMPFGKDIDGKIEREGGLPGIYRYTAKNGNYSLRDW